MPAFEPTTHHLLNATLEPLTAASADKLGDALAAIPPWSTIGWPADRIARSLQRELPSVRRYEVLATGELAGVMTIQDPFLHGPYLQLFAILPAFQGHKLGWNLLQWMEAEALRAEARQLWLCVSTFNGRARALYERFGFEAVAVLDKLASDTSDELLMRKRLVRAVATPPS
jgi:ribosomal protein S18 acetylase RimI-like enzyme